MVDRDQEIQNHRNLQNMFHLPRNGNRLHELSGIFICILELLNKNVDRAQVQNRRDQNRPKKQSSNKSQKRMQRKSRKENENPQLLHLQILLLIQKVNRNKHERNCCQILRALPPARQTEFGFETINIWRNYSTV